MDQELTQGQRIRKLRLEKRYTQEYLAKMLCTTKQAIYKYEADIVTNIPPQKFLLLAQLLGTTPEALKGAPDGAPAADGAAFYAELITAVEALAPEARRQVLAYARFLQTQPHGTAG
jgi:transcriptional regulator with XRE-family HTH domain